MPAVHMWQDVLHNEMHDNFDTFLGPKVKFTLSLELGSVFGHLNTEQIVPYI